MAIYNWGAIYLGTAADMDPDESGGNATAENAASLLGTYGTTDQPLRDNVVSVSVDDADNDTNINYDNTASPETMTVDGVPHLLDSGVVYNATITYMDDTTATITAVVLQTTTGELYLAPEMSANADFDAMEAKPIKSLSLDSVSVATTTMGANRMMTSFVCFSAGTMIATPTGQVAVEHLRIGDMVQTIDHGPQQIRWIGSREIGSVRQLLHSGSVPVTIPPDAFGKNLPSRPLVVSRQHRVLIRSPVAKHMFGTKEILLAAKHLLGLWNIHQHAQIRPVRYFHIALDRHEILIANGLHVESLLDGPQTQAMLGSDQYKEYVSTMKWDHGRKTVLPARPIVNGRHAKSFLTRVKHRTERHSKRVTDASV